MKRKTTSQSTGLGDCKADPMDLTECLHTETGVEKPGNLN